MDETTYLNFDLRLERRDDGYLARVARSPVGEARAALGRALPDAAPGPDADPGGALFQAVFRDEVLTCLRRSLDEAERQGQGLRLRLRLADVPELAGLPWETLHDAALDRYFGLSRETPLVRYLDLPHRVEPLAVEPPLRVLAVLAGPQDRPALDVEGEWARLRQAVEPLVARGGLVLERLEAATLPALQQRLRRGRYHVLHYVGHGAFDEREADGLLLLEDEAGLSRPVGGRVLGALLREERTLRLAVLNACEGARGSARDPFSGVAQGLVRQRIPAVVAMQAEISDAAAAAFAAGFYATLADGYPVDAAVAEARLSILVAGHEEEWGRPVLYMRAPDGRLFDLGPGQGSARLVPRPVRVERPLGAAGAPGLEPAYTGRNRPALGGDSLGHQPSGSTATLSCLVVDRHDPGRVYVLGDWSGLCPQGARRGDPILQPGGADGGSLNDVIATLSRWVPLRDDPARAGENLPAAIAQVSRRADVSPQVHDIGGYLQGVRTPFVGMEVFAVGRTSGLVRGEVLRTDAYVEMALPLGLIEGGVRGGTGSGSDAVPVLLAGLVGTSVPLQPGDCGAILVDRENFALGIGLAATRDGSVFMPLREVLNALDVDLITQDLWRAMV